MSLLSLPIIFSFALALRVRKCLRWREEENIGGKTDGEKKTGTLGNDGCRNVETNVITQQN